MCKTSGLATFRYHDNNPLPFFNFEGLTQLSSEAINRIYTKIARTHNKCIFFRLNNYHYTIIKNLPVICCKQSSLNNYYHNIHVYRTFLYIFIQCFFVGFFKLVKNELSGSRSEYRHPVAYHRIARNRTNALNGNHSNKQGNAIGCDVYRKRLCSIYCRYFTQFITQGWTFFHINFLGCFFSDSIL